jgi:peptidoglycan/LPS O-acetylase OafA/YrhL
MLAHYRATFFVEYGLLPESQQNIFTQIFYLLTRFGEEPVLVFFVLSGFLVGGNAIEKILNNRIDVKSYSIDRLVRIFLPLIASSILVVIIFLITSSSIPYTDIVGSFFSLQGTYTECKYNPVLWSLAYEVWFYILMGCVMYLCKKNNSYMILAFLILTLCMYMLVRLKPLYLFIWFMGAFAFLFSRDKISNKRIKIIVLLIMLPISFIGSQITSDSRSITISSFDFLNRDITSLFLALIVCFLLHYLITAIPSGKYAIKIDKIGNKLASFSYSLYLTHHPLMGLLLYCGFPQSRSLSTKSFSLYIIELLIGLIIAYLVYLMSEKHTYRVKLFLKGEKPVKKTAVAMLD